MITFPTNDARWHTYHLTRGNGVAEFFRHHLAEGRRDLLLIMARSFDPRSLIGPQAILDAGGSGRRHALLVAYDNAGGPAGDPALSRDAQTNYSKLQALLPSAGTIQERPIRVYSDDGRRIASQRAGEFITDTSDFDSYSDIVLDVSGMPRSIFFPLIARLLYLLDNEIKNDQISRNLFILVAEDPDLDAAITPTGMEEFADFVAMFRGSFDQESYANLPTVWMPVLGEGRLTQLQRIYDLVKAEEICPVLPSPARNPRRADDLVLEYREFFFGEHNLDPRDFEHASEDNPFDVYRRLRSAVLHYEHTLQTLHGCRIAFSALSSKLMSLGVVLAAYEAKQAKSRIGIAHVDSHGYQIQTTPINSQLYSLWITGECYG